MSIASSKHVDPELASLWQRTKAYLDLVFVDHGFFRAVYQGFYQVAPGVYRSNQPAPPHFNRIERCGVKTIINLRGQRDCGAYRLEREQCARRGIALVDFPIGSREGPSRERLHRAKELFETVEHPILMHCKSGADRVGFMSAFYLFAQLNAPLTEATQQLHWRYGHFKQSKTGVLDFFFEEYQRRNAAEPIPFFDWVDREYDPDALKARFKPTWVSAALVDRVLRRE